MAAPIIKVYDTDKEVSDELCKFVIEKANAAIEAKHLFTVGVSGKHKRLRCHIHFSLEIMN